MSAADPTVPAPELLFPPVRDVFGLRLALVFGNQAPDGVCPFYRTDCHHCDIGAGEGIRFSIEGNRRRLAWFRQHYAELWDSVAHLVVYNSGSVLNEGEMTPQFLTELLAFARLIPSLRIVSLDSREQFVTTERVVTAARTLGAPRQVRVVLGLESADDVIRNRLLEKRMKRSRVEWAVGNLGEAARIGERLRATVGLGINIVVGAPGTAGRVATDARDTARYSLDLARRNGLPLGLNLHPYYPSRRGIARFPDHPRPTPGEVLDAVAAVRAEVEASGWPADVFVGLHDEGHDTDPMRRETDLATLREGLTP